MLSGRFDENNYKRIFDIVLNSEYFEFEKCILLKELMNSELFHDLDDEDLQSAILRNDFAKLLSIMCPVHQMSIDQLRNYILYIMSEDRISFRQKVKILQECNPMIGFVEKEFLTQACKHNDISMILKILKIHSS